MPSVQRGQVFKRGDGWQVRYYDEKGGRRQRAGFPTKSAAGEWLDTKVDEVAALRRGDVAAVRRQAMPTLDELCDEFLAQHAAEPNTIRALTHRLVSARRTFGSVPVDRLVAQEIALWRKTLPPRSAWAYTKALRQVLTYAVRSELLTRSPAAAVANPEPKRREVLAFEALDDLAAVGDELSPPYRALPTFAALTGLRPEEWIALERRDVDREAGIVHVRRVHTDGTVKLYGKSSRSLRAVPLPARAAQALAEVPSRLDTPLLFPAERGGHLNLHNWRRDEWTPAVRATGLEHRTPYALRHTFATFAIAAGVGLFDVSRLMGTSVEQIDKTYGHLLPDSLDRARTALDAFIMAGDEETEVQGG